jgi:hypothetical protein
MRIALVIGKHQSIIRIRQILKLANFDLAEGIFGASGIFTRVLAGAYKNKRLRNTSKQLYK